MQMQGGFNANQYEPKQGGSSHPPAQKIQFTITGTEIKENKDKTGGYLEVELTSNMGSVIMRYNLWNQSPKAQEIAYGQLSALCRATNRYQLDWGNEGAALRGGQGLMDVGYQKGEEPTTEKPAGGYTELKKVYDLGGNEPGKAPAQNQPQTMQQPQQGQQPQNGPAPMTQQPGGGWGNQQQPQQQATQQQPQAQQGGFQQPSQQNQPGGAWQPGGGAQQTPPWGNR